MVNKELNKCSFCGCVAGINMNKNFLNALDDWSDILTNTYEEANVYEVKTTIEENQHVVPDYYYDRNPDEKYKTTFKIPNGVTSIGWSSFARCNKLCKIEIPDSVKVIKTAAFCDCENLSTVKLPKGLKQIVAYTFYKCKSLKTINFPESLIYIGMEVFKEAGLEGSCHQQLE